tara:strand:+ start:4186 stop:5142 length:957 start_codon:yes stop_codon:yes gene_type:complete
MSESLFYNRDQNISGIAIPASFSALILTPVYGSTVEFTARNQSYNTDDFYYNLIPMSVNSLTAKFGLKYDVNESNAQKLAVFFEAQSGNNSFKFAPDSSNIYQEMSGICDSYGISFVNNQHYQVAASISVDHAPTLLNWSGMGSFPNLSFQGWKPSTSYKKFDVIFSGINQNKLDNFYYCSGDHSSTTINSPTGSSSMWSQKFFFEPDIGNQTSVNIKADKLEYKNSFIQRLKTNDNISTFDISYTFSNISDAQTKSMIHFLESKGGYRRFEHQIPSVYNRPKVYYSDSWSHTWNYINSNTLTVNFKPDPLGIIPTGT